MYAMLADNRQQRTSSLTGKPTVAIWMWALTLALSFVELEGQNNPICKAKRYQCEDDSHKVPDGACVYVSDEQEKYYYVKPCSGDKSFCPSDKATFKSPAMCESPAVVKTSKLPFDACSADSECLSLNCPNGKCKGKLRGETCKSHSDCDAGLYCSLGNLCTQQSEFDQPCTSNFDCVNNCACNLKKCAFYYTFADGAKADNPEVCISGYIIDGKCAPGLRTKHPGNPCTTDADCQFIDENGKVQKLGNCTCGFNAGSYSYCNLETGDQEFKDMTRALRFLTARNYGCHTLRRFGPCSNLYDDEYNDYHFKLNRFKMSPLIIGNDVCAAKVYNWDYWKFFLGASQLQVTLALICALTLII